MHIYLPERIYEKFKDDKEINTIDEELKLLYNNNTLLIFDISTDELVKKHNQLKIRYFKRGIEILKDDPILYREFHILSYEYDKPLFEKLLKSETDAENILLLLYSLHAYAMTYSRYTQMYYEDQFLKVFEKLTIDEKRRISPFLHKVYFTNVVNHGDYNKEQLLELMNKACEMIDQKYLTAFRKRLLIEYVEYLNTQLNRIKYSAEPAIMLNIVEEYLADCDDFGRWGFKDLEDEYRIGNIFKYYMLFSAIFYFENKKNKEFTKKMIIKLIDDMNEFLDNKEIGINGLITNNDDHLIIFIVLLNNLLSILSVFNMESLVNLSNLENSEKALLLGINLNITKISKYLRDKLGTEKISIESANIAIEHYETTYSEKIFKFISHKFTRDIMKEVAEYYNYMDMKFRREVIKNGDISLNI